MVHSLNRKNLHINGLNILQNPKNPIPGVFLSIIHPQNEFFSKKVIQLHVEFQKNPMSRFGEKFFTY